jgi:hypothetical protein
MFYLHELRYGFEPERLCIRLMPPERIGGTRGCGISRNHSGQPEVTLMANLSHGKLVEYAVEQMPVFAEPIQLGFRCLRTNSELAIHKELFDLRGATRLRIGVALAWRLAGGCCLPKACSMFRSEKNTLPGRSGLWHGWFSRTSSPALRGVARANCTAKRAASLEHLHGKFARLITHRNRKQSAGAI